MADWIKLDKATLDKPEVSSIAEDAIRANTEAARDEGTKR